MRLSVLTSSMTFEVAFGVLYSHILRKLWNMSPLLKSWSL